MPVEAADVIVAAPVAAEAPITTVAGDGIVSASTDGSRDGLATAGARLPGGEMEADEAMRVPAVAISLSALTTTGLEDLQLAMASMALLLLERASASLERLQAADIYTGAFVKQDPMSKQARKGQPKVLRTRADLQSVLQSSFNGRTLVTKGEQAGSGDKGSGSGEHLCASCSGEGDDMSPGPFIEDAEISLDMSSPSETYI